MGRSLPAALLILEGLASPSASAQIPADPCARREVTVSIPDANGKPGEWPHPEDFRVEVRGRKARVARVRLEPTRKRVVVLLDGSSSMFASKSKWGLAREIGRSVVQDAGQVTSVALMVFGEDVLDTAGFDAGREEVLAKFDVLPEKNKELPKGHYRTAIYDTIEEALVLLGTPQAGDAICVITDGGDDFSKTSRSRVQKDLLASGTRLFSAVFLGDDYWIGRTTISGENVPFNMIDLAEDTGGFVVPVTTSMNSFQAEDYRLPEGDRVLLVTELQVLMASIESTYRLEIELDAGLEKEARLRLTLDPSPKTPVPAKKEKKAGAAVIFPHRLAACHAGRKQSSWMSAAERENGKTR